MVLVHHKRLPRWKKNDLDLPYYGPFMVTDVGPTSVGLCASPRFGGGIEVGFPFLKRYTLMDEFDLDLEGFDDKMAAEDDELNDDQDQDMTSELRSTEDSEGEGQLPDVNTKEMKAKVFTRWKLYCHQSTGMAGDSWSSGRATAWQRKPGNPTQRLSWTKGT